MPTISQLIKNSRSVEKKKSKSRALQNNPQKRGVCTRVYTTTPKNLILHLERLLGLDLRMVLR